MTLLDILCHIINHRPSKLFNGTYRSKNSIHKLVHVFRSHQVTTLENAHGELWNDRQMLAEGLADVLA